MEPWEFEEIARCCPETVGLEFLGGRLGPGKARDGDHSEIVARLQQQSAALGRGLWLYGERGLVVEQYRKGRARADGVLAPRKHFAGQGEWADPEGVLMTVEVTSYDDDTDMRDRVEKPLAYAAAGIPVHLLIDREHGTVTVYSGPDGERYRDTHTVRFGEDVVLPEPVGFALPTEEFTKHVR
ncbi:Uma2 family endonuclease [Streptomyces sp. NRRL S-1868]|uniref:Uma2 family endonuclease n=1 Tax=Streptomyces sp. NRRL S-1868 TaxID=1463892 RepID=UPI0004C5F525|nr:Uma2 family endonuclease [Streptomyces sp. NRRL S-1868]